MFTPAACQKINHYLEFSPGYERTVYIDISADRLVTIDDT
jgi:hypothetical protein